MSSLQMIAKLKEQLQEKCQQYLAKVAQENDRFLNGNIFQRIGVLISGGFNNHMGIANIYGEAAADLEKAADNGETMRTTRDILYSLRKSFDEVARKPASAVGNSINRPLLKKRAKEFSGYSDKVTQILQSL